jgi:hypothetical protein
LRKTDFRQRGGVSALRKETEIRTDRDRTSGRNRYRLDNRFRFAAFLRQLKRHPERGLPCQLQRE